ncbi:MAG: YgaP family membrane protein [Myxococcota bacterium]
MDVGGQTAQRTGERTRDETKAGVRQRMRESVRYFARHPEHIGRRLGELDREWDLERTLLTDGAVLGLAGVALTAITHKPWWLLSAAVSAVLLQYGLRGWCPPLPALRRLGFRTAEEIAAERYALRTLRGDFEHVGRDRGDPDTLAREALEAVSRA